MSLALNPEPRFLGSSIFMLSRADYIGPGLAGQAAMQNRYYDYNTYLRGLFGCRVQKIMVDAGLTCPNRDGSVSTGGCIYCNARGSGTGAHARGLSITEQLTAGKKALTRRYRAEKFIAYFQAFSNTYAPLAMLKALYEEALAVPDVVGLAIGTRPDCVSAPVLDLLEGFAGSFLALAKTPSLATEVTLQPLARFPLDAAILFSDILTVPDAMGLGLSFGAGEGPRFATPVRDEAAVAAKGAPEAVADLCHMSPAERESLTKNVAVLAPERGRDSDVGRQHERGVPRLHRRGGGALGRRRAARGNQTGLNRREGWRPLGDSNPCYNRERVVS